MLEERELRRRLGLIRDVVYGNLMRDYLPFPIDRELASGWARAEGVRRGGPVIIYTSYMYQMAPAFRSMERLLPALGQLGRLRPLASLGARLLRPGEEELRRAYSILRNIYRAVRAAGLDPGYLYEEEPYSGALLYELGFLEEFREYGGRLLEFFRERGVEEIITVDPHTTFALDNHRRLGGFDIKFRSYLEVLKDGGARLRGSGRFAIHDSCIYSRLLGMHGLLRELARGAGLELVEDELVTGRGMAYCCGGPLGPLDPEVAERVARSRAEALRSLLKGDGEVLAFCPICRESLSPYVPVRDFAEAVEPWAGPR